MTTWAPQKRDTVGALATEILHNYSKGRVLVAVDGPDAEAAAVFADDLAAAIRETGHAGARASIDDYAARVQASDWTEGPADALMVVDGVLEGHADLSGLWNYAVWVVGYEVGDRSPAGRTRATAVIDNSDPEHPRRLFDDAC